VGAPDGHTHVVRLGVAGHRTLDDPQTVAREVRAALAMVPAVCGVVAGETVTLEVVSPLAEGADRLVAREALRLARASLSAVLPFARREYERDFATAASRAEFDELLARAVRVDTVGSDHDVAGSVAQQQWREQAYAAVGRWVVEHADVLIAVWDGLPARGLGGTADVVDYARRRGVPVLWVHAAGDAGPELLAPR
jgi:hypothetical protein